MAGRDLLDDAEPVELGHPDVQEGEVVGGLGQRLDGLDAVGGLVDRTEPAGLDERVEEAAEAGPGGALVVDDQDA